MCLSLASVFSAPASNVSNIDFMGQGEPLINIKNLKIAVKILKDKKGLNYGNKKRPAKTGL